LDRDDHIIKKVQRDVRIQQRNSDLILKFIDPTQSGPKYGSSHDDEYTKFFYFLTFAAISKILREV
jgi:hypothetical protein